MQKKFIPNLKKVTWASLLQQWKSNNITLRDVNDAIRNHPVELIGQELRGYMTDMKRIAVAG